jgi:hypothetical protein
MRSIGGIAILLGLTLTAGAQDPAAGTEVPLEEQVRQLREQLQAIQSAIATQQAFPADRKARQSTLDEEFGTSPTSLVERYAEEAGEAADEAAIDGSMVSDAGCATDSCFCNQCDSGWIYQFDECKWVKVGAGLRTSFRSRESVGGRHRNDFNVDNARIYISGQGHPLFGFELNTDINNAQGFDLNSSGFGGESLDASEVRMLDAIIKMKITDNLNLWAGRMLPPSDRSNLSGPFYLNAWLFPYTQFGYNNIFQGRDDGASLWGQYGDGAFKWQIGAFDGENAGGPIDVGHPQNDKLMFTGRVVVNLLDPEPGYYNSSTYYGEKDILAIGASMMHRQDHLVGPAGGNSTADYTAWNIDFLWEQQLGGCGVFTIEAAYYDFDDENGTAPAGGAIRNPTGVSGDLANRQGESWFLLGSYLIPRDVSIGCLSGRFQFMTRYQQYDHANIGGVGGGKSDQIDIQLNYILNGHNARITALWTQHDAAAPGRDDLNAFILGTQLQF